MGIDSVNTKIRVYSPVRPKARAKLNVDDVMPVDETPKSSDEESREDRPRQGPKKRSEQAANQPPGRDQQGKIDEHI